MGAPSHNTMEVKNGDTSTSKHHHGPKNMESLTYQTPESDAYKAYIALDRYHHRGQFWNTTKHQAVVQWTITALIGIVQGGVAYCANVVSTYCIDWKFEGVYSLLEEGHLILAFLRFLAIQTMFAAMAAAFVWWEPIAAGSGIPEVKCFLNGMDLPRVGAPATLLAKVLGVICSVSAGLPVGKEGPMVHSGSVVATTLSSGQTRNDSQVRDFVACGAAAGVCTAFSAPIGGILFALEEGASYWGPSLTWRTFFCSMIALTTLYLLNTLGSAFGKVGFNKLFSFGNFIYEGDQSSFAVFELALFVAIGAIGGIVGAIFNNTNERITHWRLKNVNYSRKRRFYEVLCVSLGVTTLCFGLSLAWVKCTPLPTMSSPSEQELLDQLVAFRCEPGKEYNELASLIFTEPGVAIRQLFHLHQHAFSDLALFLFFGTYIFMAVVVYGIAIPSGLFVPSLLSGAALGRLFGNLLARSISRKEFAYANTYSLMGAAAVLGGMARMTISLTVILLECTGNEQFVLPLMLTLMTARLVGGLFNDDLYHIHIHLKKGVQFLEAELQSSAQHHELVAGQIMGENVIFFHPVENVGTLIDVLRRVDHSTFPVVDDSGTLYGTIARSELCHLLKARPFGQSPLQRVDSASNLAESQYIGSTMRSSDITVGSERYLSIVGWETVEGTYPKYPSPQDIRIHRSDRSKVLDLRPYVNQSPISIPETATLSRTYHVFRSLGLQFLPVVNKSNQVVGTITRSDLSSHGLAQAVTKQKHV